MEDLTIVKRSEGEKQIITRYINYREITVSYDDIAENPRCFSDFGIMACFHKRYEIGDDMHKGEDPHEFRKWVTTSKDVAAYFPIYMYDHSGITISTKPFSCPWDSGLLGYIYVTKERVEREYGKNFKDLEKVKARLLREVEIMDVYLRGDIYVVNFVEDGENIDTYGEIYGRDELKRLLKEEVPEGFEKLAKEILEEI